VARVARSTSSCLWLPDWHGPGETETRPLGCGKGQGAVVNPCIGITDYDWFLFLSALPGVDEVNFWQPGGRTNFRALQPGELFLFKLHAPRNFIVGFGVFARPVAPPSLTGSNDERTLPVAG